MKRPYFGATIVARIIVPRKTIEIFKASLKIS